MYIFRSDNNFLFNNIIVLFLGSWNNLRSFKFRDFFNDSLINFLCDLIGSNNWDISSGSLFKTCSTINSDSGFWGLLWSGFSLFDWFLRFLLNNLWLFGLFVNHNFDNFWTIWCVDSNLIEFGRGSLFKLFYSSYFLLFYYLSYLLYNMSHLIGFPFCLRDVLYWFRLRYWFLRSHWQLLGSHIGSL